MINNIKNIIEYIKRSNDFIVTSHISPDGDNIGSTLGIYYTLKKLNKNVRYVLDDTIPLNMRFLVKDIEILRSEDIKDSGYTLICMDCGDEKRICVNDDVKNNASTLINIDHHVSNKLYGDLNYVDSEGSSTCELVYNMLTELENMEKIKVVDEVIATALYTGLLTDTGNFTYSNAKPSSFEMAKNLIIAGANKELIVQKVFQSNTYNYYKLLGEALNSLDIIDNKIAVISVTHDMLNRNNISFNDVDGVTNYTRDILGVEVGILLKQKKENEIKVSLRAKSYVDVSKIAVYFGGGGHIKAAGCTVNDSIENAKEKIVAKVKESLRTDLDE